MKKIAFFILILAFVISSCFAQQKKFQISGFFGLNHFFEYGSEKDHEPGINDFPVTPAHNPRIIGAAFAFFLTKNLGIELDGRYISESKMTLEDPSDQDKVEIHSSKHYSLTLNVLFQFLKGKFRPYIVAGGGTDKLLAKEETLVSEYGWEVEFITPEKTADLIIHAGAGAHYSLSKKAGLRMDLRYEVIFCDPHNLKSISLFFGAFLRF